MSEFNLIVKKGTDDDEIENLKSTSTLKEMVRAIKREYCVSNYGVFSLQDSDGIEFYEDTEEININDEETEITLEEFFGNADSAEIIYVAKKAGKNDLMIGNATDENLIAEIRYGTINRQIQSENKDFEIDPNLNITEMSGGLRFHWQNPKDYYQSSLENRSQKEIINLNAHGSGKLLQIALNNGHEKGTHAAYVGIHRIQEDALDDLKTPVTAFKVEPGETWVLFPSVGLDIRYGKTKRKLFSRHQEKWVDKDGQDRDPHACLKKGEDCGVQTCLNRAKQNGSMTGEKHRRLPNGKKCITCGRYEQKD